MTENKENKKNKKPLVVTFSEWTDIDAFLELLLLIKNTNASILVLLSVGKTYGVDKNVISYEEVIEMVYEVEDKEQITEKMVLDNDIVKKTIIYEFFSD